MGGRPEAIAVGVAVAAADDVLEDRARDGGRELHDLGRHLHAETKWAEQVHGPTCPLPRPRTPRRLART